MATISADRTLAQIVKVIDIRPIVGADKVELATVLGWDVVVEKGSFHVGDLAIYFSIGGILDKDNPNTAFLQGQVLKTKTIRGVVSQGLLGKLDWLEYYGIDPSTMKEDDDVTDRMNVKKWISSDEIEVYDNSDKSKSVFPPIIPKTDEPRVQNCYKKVLELKDKNIIITQKFDGTSTTYIHSDGVFMICNRNNRLNYSVSYTNHYFDIANRYDLEKKMISLGKNIAIQGEIIGPKINGNHHKVNDIEFYVFNIFDIDLHSYMSYDEILKITGELGLKTIKVVYTGPMKDEWLSSKALLTLANEQLYETGTICEGIVIKSDMGFGYNRISFKAISNKYLLKHKL